ncbi:hypothetical protein GCM10022255_015260 [Dactylosporangium darangshiense]|uniref:PH domain-containing protein n=1 Tax=Dactylosporangium darangshiense TaxID=579108 RepID=A0ABP8D1B5_9ACTN
MASGDLADGAGPRRELRLSPSPDERQLLWIRSLVAAAGTSPPVADECPDRERFAESSQALAGLGPGGRLRTVPGQVALADGIFAVA